MCGFTEELKACEVLLAYCSTIWQGDSSVVEVLSHKNGAVQGAVCMSVVGSDAVDNFLRVGRSTTFSFKVGVSAAPAVTPYYTWSGAHSHQKDL